MKTNLKTLFASLILAVGFFASQSAEARPYWHDYNWNHGYRYTYNNAYNSGAWRAGHWSYVNHFGRMGWWWVNAGGWTYYNAPVYPYPQQTVIYEQPVYEQQPQVETRVVTVQAPPAQPPQALPSEPANDSPIQRIGPTSTLNYYYCSSPAGYYPTVSNCGVAWQKVPSTPN